LLLAYLYTNCDDPDYDGFVDLAELSCDIDPFNCQEARYTFNEDGTFSVTSTFFQDSVDLSQTFEGTYTHDNPIIDLCTDGMPCVEFTWDVDGNTSETINPADPNFGCESRNDFIRI